MLGDGSINAGTRASKTALPSCFVRLEQSTARTGWLLQVQDELRAIGVHVRVIPRKPRRVVACVDGREIRGGPSLLLYTGVYDEFRTERERWYPDGTKCVPDDVTITWRSVAHWFCGDGSCSNDGSLTFYTNGFTRREVGSLASSLSALGIDAEVRERRERGEFTVRLPGRSNTCRFADGVRPFMPECCMYKLRFVRPVKKAAFHRKLDRVAHSRVLAMRRDGASLSTIAAAVGVGGSVVHAIVQRRTYKDWTESVSP